MLPSIPPAGCTRTSRSLRSRAARSLANETGQPNGGAIYLSSALDRIGATIENSTFSDNRSNHQQGKASAIAVTGRLTLRNSTFAGNKTSPTLTPLGEGGALFVESTQSQVNLVSTLFANNTHGNAGALVDLSHEASPTSTVNVSNSLFRTNPAAAINGINTANLFSVDALIRPLTTADGGLWPVHPLSRTSPAIDRGANPAALVADQRGVGFVRGWSDPKNRAGIADIGAYEFRGDAFFAGDF